MRIASEQTALWTVFGTLLLCESLVKVSAFTTPSRCLPSTRSALPSIPPLSRRSFLLAAPVQTTAATTTTTTSSLNERVLDKLESLKDEANEFAEMYGLSTADASFYGLFKAVRMAPAPLGLKGKPFVLRHEQVAKALQVDSTTWPGFFTMTDLEKAVSDDFLDAARGSTDNRKGWKISAVQNGVTFEDVRTYLDKGTVIFNSAGAHIPKLAGPSLACTDATNLPCALNLYVTDKGKRTSAPPHTDMQDVVVVQTSGRKFWRVYAPPDPARKPLADIFVRGKGADNLPLHSLEDDQLLIETTLNPGDVLFIPAAFPHTTSTVTDGESPETSIHVTVNFDTHIWELDYLSARRLALRRAGVADTALGQTRDEDNRYVGKANELPAAVRNDLFDVLPDGLLDEDDAKAGPMIDLAAKELERISRQVDEETASAVDASVWKDTIERLRQEGMELYDIHRDMYLAAISEGEKRDAEDAMTAHLVDQPARKAMTPDRMQRLSVYRVNRYYDKVDAIKKALKDWSYEGKQGAATDENVGQPLAADWAFSLPVKVGDQVEADLGGAFFPATVTRASGDTYDVQYFDGDSETGMDRSLIKLLKPPVVAADVDTSNMTPKQLKRLKKQQQKLNEK